MFEGGLYPYWIVIFLMMTGLYVVISRDNLVKKIIGMNIFQTAIILFFVSTGVKKGGSIPIVDKYQALAGGILCSKCVLGENGGREGEIGNPTGFTCGGHQSIVTN